MEERLTWGRRRDPRPPGSDAGLQRRMDTPYSVEQHVALRRVSEIAASPCGRWLAVTVQRLDRDGARYVSDLWRVPTDGGPPTQLTRGDCRDVAPCFRHDGALGFLSNRQPTERKADDDADKRMQVWLLPAAGGEPQQLTDEPLGVETFRFAAHADRMVLFASVLGGVPHERQRETHAQRTKQGPTARRFKGTPVRHWDHWLHDNDDLATTHFIVCDASGGQRRDLTPNARRDFAIEPTLCIARDGRMAVTTRQRAGKDRGVDSTLWVVDLDSGAERVLGDLDNVEHTAPVLSPDGRFIATTRTIRDPARASRLVTVIYEVATGECRELGQDWDRWPLIAAWSRDGSALVVTADDCGFHPIFAMSIADGQVARISAESARGAHPQVIVLADGHLAAIRSTLRDAPECYTFALEPGALPFPLARLSGFEEASGWTDLDNFYTPSVDGTLVHSFLLKPKGASGPLPLALWIHGGPIGMDTDGWHWRWNPLLLVAQGYAVALPNPRGSTGFGQEYVQGIWGNVWGELCYDDLMAVADAVCARPDIDETRTMAMGGSFGGYMTNWIGSQTDRFRCLITHASIATMTQFTGVTDHPAWWYVEMGGENPYADPERFDRYAPLRFVAQWKTPILIIHGEKDYRCPVNEALNLFEALQYHGVDSELLIFPDENHWVLRPRNIKAWYEAVLGYLARHLGP